MFRGFFAPLLVVLAVALAACASRPIGNLIAVSATAPGASTVDMIVTTTRAPVEQPAGVMFNGERAHGTAFADIAVSIPPDDHRKVGEVEWPSSVPGDPTKDFVTLRAERLDLAGVKSDFNQKLEQQPSGHVLVFVHGYNTTFEEAVYRFAQIVHDSGAPVVPLLFTWPSRGQLLSYVYDRDSAMYSRDSLEGVLQAIIDNPKVKTVSVLAHSMGNFVAVETLRQMAIRHNGLSPKIKDIMLASPDIDFEVFRREIAEIVKSRKSATVTLFVSNDDKALSLSSFLAGDAARLGSINPLEEPYRSNLERAGVSVVDLSATKSDDSLNHGKFEEGEVVKKIGQRLALGQTLTDSH